MKISPGPSFSTRVSRGMPTVLHRFFSVFITTLLIRITNTSSIRQYSRRQEYAFDEFWKQLDSGNYTKGLNQIPVDLFEPIELDSLSQVSVPLDRPCPSGQFQLGNSRCFNRLNCEQIQQQISPHSNILATGIGKQIRIADWYYSYDQNVQVAYVETRPSRLSTPRIAKRVKQGAENIMGLQSSKHATAVVGYCYEQEKNNTLLISEFCRNGNLAIFVNGDEYASWGACKRFELATSLVEALAYLHDSPIGTRINCDMNRLHRALTQFLVTDDYRVVLNDVDDIPESGSKCLWSRFVEEDSKLSSFLAPEQRLNTIDTHTEKIDIWKIPDLVMHILLKNCGEERSVKYQVTQLLLSVRSILNQCKSLTPEGRPGALKIVGVFRQALSSCRKNGW